ncbi:MAG TPA: hypothetical protein PKA13_21960 [Geminicoccaceae bacterium]|nr:hypothetical protein [Geminicoccus sp.]HMU52460.1 hypothetical protein [Geminicoccaceae bacterium]
MPAEARKSSLVDDVRLIFDLASLKREASCNLGAEGWQELRKINEAHEGQRRSVEQDFELSYGERLAAARQRLIDEAGNRRLDHVPRLLGHDRFDRSVIDRQARIEVRQAYRSALDHIDREEARQIGGLLAQADRKNQAREVPLRDFARATDHHAPDRSRRRD